MGESSGCIVVHRPPGRWRDLCRRYRIEIDGERRATIRRGASVRVQVLPGRHTVRAAIDWAGSPEIRVDVAPDQVVDLEVHPAGGPWSAMSQLTKSRYLVLSVRDGQAGDALEP